MFLLLCLMVRRLHRSTRTDTRFPYTTLFRSFAYPVIGLMLAVLALGYSLLPVVFPLAAGVSILGPAVAAGFYELARRREQGLDSSWRHFFDVFSGPSFVPQIGRAHV